MRQYQACCRNSDDYSIIATSLLSHAVGDWWNQQSKPEKYPRNQQINQEINNGGIQKVQRIRRN
ncbi:MAG: hypothetical protein HC908_01590 [Calothrix sp. SM1_7_51]|nr:hypothetical protein [Calothrix sp. SM1_7_51]